MKKSQLRNIIKESIREVLNEQYLGPNAPCTSDGRRIEYTVCGPPDLMASYGSNVMSGNYPCITVNGQVPQVGQKVELPMIAAATGENAIGDITAVAPASGPSNLPNNNFPLVGDCSGGATGSTGCSLQDFQQAAAGVTGLPAPFLANIHNKFANHPDGCRFLNNRLQIQQQGSNNPTAAAQKALKVQALQAIIAQCC